MKPINNYDSVTEAKDGFEVLPAGGYVCKIEQCVEKPNKNGGTHLEISFDIAEGDYRGWFAEDWKRQTKEDKVWRGIIRQNVPNEESPKYDLQCGFFKRFTNAIEASNEGYHWDWNELGLKGKLVGIVFREYERESANGTRYMTTRSETIYSASAIRDGKFKVPAPKMLEAVNKTASSFAEAVNEDDLPF